MEISMIEYPGRIFFSRWEKPNKDNGWLYSHAYKLCVEARTLFFADKKFENEDWKSWHVLELHGWEDMQLHVVWFDMFGVHPYPAEKRRIVYHRASQQLEDLEIHDPFILHNSHQLVPREKYKGDPLSNKNDRARWHEKVDELYIALAKHAIIYHPGAHQSSTWDMLQKMKKIEILNLPDEDNPTRIDGWKVVEVDPEFGYADFSKL